MFLKQSLISWVLSDPATVRLMGSSRCSGELQLQIGREWRAVDAQEYLRTEKLALVLENGSSRCSGRLEVKSNNWWSSVCEDDFDLLDAEVVCRELGCGAPSVLQGALYGEAEAPILSREFLCEGHESVLLDCGSSWRKTKACPPDKAVGLTCSEEFRLVGTDSRCAGGLQSRIQGSEWREEWKINVKSLANVCRRLDCGSLVSVGETRDNLNITCSGEFIGVSLCDFKEEEKNRKKTIKH
uniref:SRCR domain-containing protein n=1 Tax=Oryzias latipes TaxID=8090 RepID=A0A3P9LHV3_ORYLA